MCEMTVCNYIVRHLMNDEPTKAAALFSFIELYSDFQLNVKLSDYNFTVLVHSQRSHSVIFSCSYQRKSSKSNFILLA